MFRQASALYRACRLSEAEYLDLAVSMAQDQQRLAALRENLRRKMQEVPFMDSKVFATTVATALSRPLDAKGHP